MAAALHCFSSHYCFLILLATSRSDLSISCLLLCMQLLAELLTGAALAIAYAKTGSHLCTLNRHEHPIEWTDCRRDILEAAERKTIVHLEKMEKTCESCIDLLLKQGRERLARKVVAAAVEKVASRGRFGALDALIAFGKQAEPSALPLILE